MAKESICQKNIGHRFLLKLIFIHIKMAAKFFTNEYIVNPQNILDFCVFNQQYTTFKIAQEFNDEISSLAWCTSLSY